MCPRASQSAKTTPSGSATTAIRPTPSTSNGPWQTFPPSSVALAADASDEAVET